MVEAVIGLVVAGALLGACTLLALGVRALSRRAVPAVVPDEDLLTWAATHPDRVHCPDSLQGERL